jgi:hypothetical protein
MPIRHRGDVQGRCCTPVSSRCARHQRRDQTIFAVPPHLSRLSHWFQVWLALLSPCRYVASVMNTYTTEELVSELRTIGTEMRARAEQGNAPGELAEDDRAWSARS